MTTGAGRLPAEVRGMFESARFSSALSLTIVGTAFSTQAIRSMVGWPGLLGILVSLCVLAAFSFIAHRGAIEWQGLLPISILLFAGWCAISVIWSQYQWATAAGVLYQFMFAFLAVYLALVRDAIQIVRVVGDVLRALLAVSLALEILSGLLIDMPIRFLAIQGNLARGGPISGIFGSRNELGLVALIALVTFVVELRTRSVSRGKASFSIALSALCLVLTSSPVIAVVLLVVVLAVTALSLVRRVRNARSRFYWQIAIGALAVAGAVTGFLLRARIIELLNAGNVIQVRYDVWIQMLQVIPTYQLQGWGWIGTWNADFVPFSIVNALTGQPHANGLDAYLDVYLQVGLVGLLLFILLISLALGRSWLLASNKRSIIYVWPPLVLTCLLTVSFAESAVLVESGWMLLVICSVKAAQGMSWRDALPK
ncbi:MAG TPA: exopolysaccharide production protein [Humibacter sp.]|nr:exopolysaccharide production protein [Humibacter sp.]